MPSTVTWRARLAALVCFLLPLTCLAAPADGDVLVFGGTGKLGSDIVKELVADGRSVTVFARPSSARERLQGLDVSYVTGDVTVEADVEAAFKAADFGVAIDALGRSGAGVDFYVVAGEHLAKWAAETGVKQFILHGSVGAGDSQAVYPKSRWSAMKATMAAKTAQEKSVIDSGVAYTIIRNAQLPRHGTPATGKAQLFEDPMKYGQVTRADLARLTVQCVDNEDCMNKTFHAVDESLPVRR
jgi:uncharacterized protein YbjT (DUF2867 family)